MGLREQVFSGDYNLSLNKFGDEKDHVIIGDVTMKDLIVLKRYLAGVWGITLD
ncbi:MAG: hypothetical protein NC223_02870 [Butyrivibrio sp.]|nr:hypothetical protein [Butyrivibrio sp.]